MLKANLGKPNYGVKFDFDPKVKVTLNTVRFKWTLIWNIKAIKLY